MLQLKIERAKDKVTGKEIWGYTLFLNGRVLKEEIKYGRLSDDDTLVQKFIRCYTWAFERVTGFLSTGEYSDEVLKVFFSCNTVYTWFEKGKALSIYREAFRNMLSKFDMVQVAKVQYYKADRSWNYKDRLKPDNITKEIYTSCLSFFDDVAN